jgi:rhodanese-related sulfurtransferase
VPGSRNIPIAQLFDRAEEIDRSAPIVVFCAGGYRSMIASSLLRAKGFTDVSDVIGGYGAWADKNLPATIPSITVEELRRDRDSYLVLDVREDDEWEHGHVDGSMHIPMAQLPARLTEIPTSHRVACLCRSGNRSAKVTAWLLANGVDALNVQGGTLAWDERGFPFAVGAQA